MESLHELEARGDYTGLIKTVRKQIKKDVKAFRDPSIKAWVGRRWRNLFIREAARDEQALRAASTGPRFFLGDKRPPAQKIAERFLAATYEREWELEMPEAAFKRIKNTTLLFCPGLLNGMFPERAFARAFPRLEEETGLRVLRADAHPMRSCAANTRDIKAALEDGRGRDAAGRAVSEPDAPEDLFVVCHEKGANDMLTLLAEQPESAGRIRGLVSWGGAVGGSQIFDELYAKIRRPALKSAMGELDGVLRRLLPRGARRHDSPNAGFARLEEFEPEAALRDLTVNRNRAFLDSNKTRLEGLNFPVFFASGSVAAREVPFGQGRGHRLLKRIDRVNDMRLTASAARLSLPMAADLGQLRAHHWDLAYPTFERPGLWKSSTHDFPRTAALIALVKLCGELGILD